MAIYSFSLKGIYRQLLNGPDRAEAGRKPLVRTSLAASAYRAGVRLKEPGGRIVDFSDRAGILHTEILVPDDAPHWTSCRQTLWSRVEKFEPTLDSLVARRVILALPHELSDEQRLQLVHNFVLENFVALGMVADISIHQPTEHPDGYQEDERNYYTHILLTTRALTHEGFSEKCHEWGEKPLLLHWRERWAVAVNTALISAGIDVRVDHRSLKSQGIDHQPGIHRGPRRPFKP